MMPKSSISQASTEIISMTIIDAETLNLSTPFGDYILKSSEPMSSISILQRIDWNTSVEVKPTESPPTPPYFPASMYEENSSQSWTVWLMKFSAAILISLSVWAILLYGLYVAAPVFLSFVGQLSLLLTALVAISSCLLIILLLYCVNGNTDRRP